MPATTPDDAAVHRVPTPKGELYVVDHAGDGPPLVLMHGFPDDSRIYSRLLPLLRPRRALTVDFLGYGRSDRPAAGALDPADHVAHLGAVLDFLDIETAVVVGHDASGPDVVDFALAAPGRVGRIVLLNTYYGHAPALRLPEMIRVLADPDLTPLADAMLEDPNQRLWLTGHTARQFGTDPRDPDGVGVVAVFPQFFGDSDQPDALPAIRAWTAALHGALEAQDMRISRGELSALDTPVTVIFGALDNYLNPDLAHHLTALFPKADLHLVQAASHWPQWDQPQAVSGWIR
jgi:2-hydroxy-6-oxonona-2,4-dienedioate hydrolase